MKSLKYFGYGFAILAIICFWIGIASLRQELSILGIVIGCLSILLILWEDDK
jgi:hypothetical protein